MHKLFIVGLLTCPSILLGQVWTNLIDSIPQQGWAVFSDAVVDSSTNTLYIAGEFFRFNQYNTNSIIRYDGSTFDTLQSGLDDQEYNATHVYKMLQFQNKLYVFGTFIKTGKYWCKSIGRWNGSSWDSVNFRPNGPILFADVYNNELYVAGAFDTIAGIASNGVAKYDGVNWYSLSNPVHDNVIEGIKNFKGKLYMAGQTTPASSSANLSFWDGSNWIPWVGVSGDANKAIFGLTVIDSMLFVYGRFNSIAGTNCRGFAAYNGTHWFGFGTGLSNSSWETVYNIQKLNGDIYISGNFNDVEGLSTGTLSSQLYTEMVKFDGQKYCVTSPPFGNVVLGVVGYNNNMYAYGAFTQIGPDSVWGFVKWNGGNTTVACSPTVSIIVSTVGIEELIRMENLKIYPNPVKDKLKIEFASFELSNVKLELANSLGEVVSALVNPRENQEIDLSGLSTGIYFLKIQTTSDQKVFKIIKE